METFFRVPCGSHTRVPCILLSTLVVLHAEPSVTAGGERRSAGKHSVISRQPFGNTADAPERIVWARGFVIIGL